MKEGEGPITSVPRLLAQHDREFIRSAYQAVLGRAPDPDGESHYLAQLRDGIHKLAILKQMRRSAEGRTFIPGVAGLDKAIKRQHRASLPIIGMLARPLLGGEGDSRSERRFRGMANELGALRQAVESVGTSSSTSVASGSPEAMPLQRRHDAVRFQPGFAANSQNYYALDEFLQLHDTSFVEAAYLAILHREPDPVGRMHYVGRVREGSSKIRVLSDLIRSEEGRAKGTRIAGLNAALAIEKALSLPIIGGILYFLFFAGTIRHHFRDMRVLENHLVRLAEEGHRLHQQEIQRLETIIKHGQ